MLIAQIMGPLLMSRAVLAIMRAGGGGAILNVSSDAGKLATPGENMPLEALPSATSREPMLSKFLVLSNATASQEEEYNQWYEHQHLSDVLSIPGFVSAQRFRFACKINEVSHWSYCVIYTINSNEPEAVVEKLTSIVAAGGMYISPALDPYVYAALYRPVGEEGHTKPE
jgi:NAD(P)-dependent dehydrogenase (short-subunit alcohol dehydrogenase family)